LEDRTPSCGPDNHATTRAVRGPDIDRHGVSAGLCSPTATRSTGCTRGGTGTCANGRAEDLAIGTGVFYQEPDAQQQMLREVVEVFSGFLHLADRSATPMRCSLRDSGRPLTEDRLDQVLPVRRKSDK
jgi:hypothetical protein